MSKPFPKFSKPISASTVTNTNDSIETSSFDKSDSFGDEISIGDDANPLGEGDDHEEETDEDEDDTTLEEDDDSSEDSSEEIPVKSVKPSLKPSLKPSVAPVIKPVLIKPVVIRKTEYLPKISSLPSAISREEVDNLLSKNENPTANLDDILRIETGESNEDFAKRKDLTHKLANIKDFKVNNMTAMVAASMLIKKTKLGVTYDANIENALSYLLSLLK